jgi:hypothetical protein
VRKIPHSRALRYLKALAETGNASLAAAYAGVSRDWAYKRRKADAWFDALCREILARFREMPPHPTLSREGRGANRRTRVNRDRAGGWTRDKEARFIGRLTETYSVWLAAAEVGLSTVSAYRRRQVRARFAAEWDEALLSGWPPADQPWIESATCFFEGREPPAGNPVRFTSVSQVLEAMKGNRFAPRRRRG